MLMSSKGPVDQATWDGHNDSIVNLERGLQNTLERWDQDKCGDPPYPGARDLAERGPVIEAEWNEAQDRRRDKFGPIKMLADYFSFEASFLATLLNGPATEWVLGGLIIILEPELIPIVTETIIYDLP